MQVFKDNSSAISDDFVCNICANVSSSQKKRKYGTSMFHMVLLLKLLLSLFIHKGERKTVVINT